MIEIVRVYVQRNKAILFVKKNYVKCRKLTVNHIILNNINAVVNSPYAATD